MMGVLVSFASDMIGSAILAALGCPESRVLIPKDLAADFQSTRAV